MRKIFFMTATQAMTKPRLLKSNKCHNRDHGMNDGNQSAGQVVALRDSSNLGQYVPRPVDDARHPCVDMDCPAAIANYWAQHVATLPYYDPGKEHLVVFALGVNLQLRGWVLLAIGPCRGIYVSLSDLLRSVLVAGGERFHVAHNHTGYLANPSREDKIFTDAVRTAAPLVGLEMVDHVIVSLRETYSFKQEGLVHP